MSELFTERELWLLKAGYSASYVAYAPIYHGNVDESFRRWMNENVADAVTVEMLLHKEAPE